MAIANAITILQESNQYLGRIVRSFEMDEQKDMQRAEKERERDGIFSDLVEAIKNISGGTSGSSPASPVVSPSVPAEDTEVKKSFGGFARLKDKIKEYGMMYLPVLSTGIMSIGGFFGNITKVFNPILNSPLFKNSKKILGKVLGKFLLPLIAVLNGLEGFFAGYEEGGFFEGLKQGGVGIINGLVGWIVELGAKAIGFMIEQFGGPEWLVTAFKEFDFGKELLAFVNRVGDFFYDVFLFWMDERERQKLYDSIKIPSFAEIGKYITDTISGIFDWLLDKVSALTKFLPEQFRLGDKIKKILVSSGIKEESAEDRAAREGITVERARQRILVDKRRQAYEKKRSAQRDMQLSNTFVSGAPSYSQQINVQGDTGNKSIKALQRTTRGQPSFTE